MDKIIFLDIDGVVNTLMIYTKPQDTSTHYIERDGFYFEICDIKDDRVSNNQAINWLNKLCKENNAKIVVSSTWRKFERQNHTVENCLRNSGLLPNIPIIGATPYTGGSRGSEIKQWLAENYPDDKVKFIILDDDSDMDDLIDHLILCDNKRGFGYAEYLDASVKINS